MKPGSISVVTPPPFVFEVPAHEVNAAFNLALRGSGYGSSPLKNAIERALEKKADDIEELVVRAVCEAIASPKWRAEMQTMVNEAIRDGLKKRVENRIGSIGAAFIVKALAGVES